MFRPFDRCLHSGSCGVFSAGARGVCLLLLLGGAWQAALGDEATLAEANRLLLTGRYEEAATAFETLLEAEPVRGAVGLARCRGAVGRYAEAEQLLLAAQEKQPEAAPLSAELAWQAFARGDHAAAQAHCDAALKLERNQLLARYVAAELHTSAGRLAEAAAAYEWFVDYYNRQRKFTEAEDLHLVGLAAAQAARWKRRSGEFRFLVNQLYPDALKLDKEYWPARLESAALFLEKYNEPQAAAELAAALAINPQAAEAHAARARLALQRFDLEAAKASLGNALEINPRLLAAKRLQGAVALAELRPAEAAELLEQARQLNPVDEETLGLLAAAYSAIDGLREDPEGTRAGKLIEEAVERNPHCGTFFSTLASGFDLLRRYPAAAKHLAEAHRRMPQLAYVRGELGLVLMRLGEEAQAGPLLAESFKIDPFNVRVKNMLAVLDVLKGYAVLETEHFVIRFDRGQDELLARYAARHLEEEVYPEIVRELGFAPPGKSLFEIFSRAKNTSGHGWFSARMVGLPFVHTVGACAGQVVALASPGEMPKKYNWARVLRHEFVHVVNLQQTNFNVPHWFTEGLAVRLENSPRPPAWNNLLAARLRSGKLFNLENINGGFIRPTSGEDWNLAYCQAALYIDYMVEKYGPEAPARMLAAYAANLGTPEALSNALGVEQAAFEGGYAEYLARLVADLAGPISTPARGLEELLAAVKENPEDADSLAELAMAHLQRGANAEARRQALAASQVVPKQQLAAYVLARLQISIGNAAEAEKLLLEALDLAAPQENALGLLAALKLRAEEFAEAEKLYLLGAKQQPRSETWQKALAKLYLQTGENEKLAAVLEWLAMRDVDDLTLRKKLAQIAIERRDYAAGARWATEAMQIDIADAEAHGWLGQALAGLGKHAAAAEEFETALSLEKGRKDWRFALAEAYIDAQQPAKARQTLELLLEQDPKYPGADVLLESLR